MSLHQTRRRWVGAGLGLLILAGCSTSSEDFVAAGRPAMSVNRVDGVLARSAGGQIALLDPPLPNGFTPMADTTVRLLGSDTSATTDASGRLVLPAREPRPRLQINTPSGSAVIVAPAFSAEAGPAIRLEHFPPRLALREGESAAARAVGVDAVGRYLPVKATQEIRPVAETPEIPHTTTLASPPLLQSAATPGSTGDTRIVSSSGDLEGFAPVSTYSEACLAMLSGQVLDQQGQPIAGAQVQVEGASASYEATASIISRNSRPYRPGSSSRRAIGRWLLASRH